MIVRESFGPCRRRWQSHHRAEACKIGKPTATLKQSFAVLLKLDDEAVIRVLTFVVAETLSCGSPMVEILGKTLSAPTWPIIGSQTTHSLISCATKKRSMPW